MYRSRRTRSFVLLVPMLLALAGCATQRASQRAESAERQQNWDAAVYYYLEALSRDPENIEYRMELVRARQKAAQEHFQRGQALLELGQLVAARDELRLAVELDPTHQYAEQVLDEVAEQLHILSMPDGQSTLAEMKRRAREAKVQPPILSPHSTEPITLRFPTPKPVKEIYQALGKAYGFNAIFDPKLKDDKLAVELNDVTSEQALEIVMRAAGHFYKVYDEHTIIIAEDTPQNRREYEDLVIKTFFLSNADVKEVDKLLRALIEARRLATNEQLNAITLRDTADKVAIAERLIGINDKAKAEVMIDVELLQVNASSNRRIGLALTAYETGITLDATRVGGEDGIYLNELSNITNGAWKVGTIPGVVLNLIKSSGEAQTLAQPQLRITEGEKASLVIGDRVPIPVTSFNTQYQGGAGGVIPITSFQYQDVGIKIEVEPRVHHNQEITLKLTVEVSQLGEDRVYGEQSQPVIGTRTISSVIRLKDGETNLLAGLYRVDTKESSAKIPFLSDLPLLGRLFTDKNKSLQTTDLVLTLTPHIVRYPDIAEEDLAPVWVGTESRISYFGNSPRLQSGAETVGPFDGGQEPTIPEPEVEPEGEPGTGVEGEEEERVPRLPPRLRPGQRVPRPDPGGLAPGGLERPDGSLGVDSPAQGRELGGATLGTGAEVELQLEPSMSSLRQGDAIALRLVASAAPDGLQLPLTVSWDPNRLTIGAVQAAPGVSLAVAGESAGEGWLRLVVAVPAGSTGPVALAHLAAAAVAPGSAPVALASDGAEDADGQPVALKLAPGGVIVLPPAAAGGAS